MKVTVLDPKGYCAGVANAINIAIKAKKENASTNTYLIGMLVHNDIVINMLKSYGIITFPYDSNVLENLKNIEDDSVIVFTADGHPQIYDEIAKEKNLKVYDPICPNVKKILTLIKDNINNNKEIIYIGVKSHTETQTALSIDKNIHLIETDDDIDNLHLLSDNPLVINQTTLNSILIKKLHDKIKQKYPNAVIHNTICNTVLKRQESILKLDENVDYIIVVGDTKSSNTNKLLSIAKTSHPNIPSIMIDNKNSLDFSKLYNAKHIAIASGASTPSTVIDDIVNELTTLK